MLIIRGIEVSQAVQYYRADRHLTDPADRGPDNSLVLVAGKPAWVRLYIENDAPGTIESVDGTLEVAYAALNTRAGEPGLTLTPVFGSSVTAEFAPDYATVRSSLNRTLNFIIPAEHMFGPLVLIASVQGQDGTEPVTRQLLIGATLRQTLRVRGVMIGYIGPDPDDPGGTLTIPPPGIEYLQGVAGEALRMMPVQSEGVFEFASTLTRSTPLTGGLVDGGCPTSWVELNAAIAAAKVADGNHPGFIYYGLLAGGFPNDSSANGCASDGVASGRAFDQRAFAHEIGHVCGRPHGPCGVGSADPNYPAYEPYDTPAHRVASTGEYGVDFVLNTVPVPAEARDYMSYCGPRWISIYGHQALIDNEALNPERVGVLKPWWPDYPLYDPWWWLHYKPDPPPYFVHPETVREFPARTRKVISVIAMLLPSERVEVLSVARTEVISTKLAGKAGELRVVLHGGRNVELASTAMHVMSSHASCGCGGDAQGKQRPVLLQGFLPDVGVGASLSIRRGATALWKRAATTSALSVSTPKVRRAKDDEHVEISWTATPARSIEDTWVRVSEDEGKTWRSVATALTGTATLVRRVHLPAGKLLFQVVVHDGFRSVHSNPARFHNEPLPPVIVILHPDPRRTFFAAESLCLWGSVAGHVDRGRDGLVYAWALDGRHVGEGLQLFTRVPEPGRHHCQLAARNSNGQVVRFTEIEFVSVRGT
jgi:hypothetical protein